MVAGPRGREVRAVPRATADGADWGGLAVVGTAGGAGAAADAGVVAAIDEFCALRDAYNAAAASRGKDGATGASLESLLEPLARSLAAMSDTLFARMAYDTADGSDGSGGSDGRLQTVYRKNGLVVFRGDYGNGHIVVQGEYLLPISPEKYCAYASNVDVRQIWDNHVEEIRLLQTLSPTRFSDVVAAIEPAVRGERRDMPPPVQVPEQPDQVHEVRDLVYVAIRRVATVFPRDYVNLRVIGPVACRFPERVCELGSFTSCDGEGGEEINGGGGGCGGAGRKDIEVAGGAGDKPVDDASGGAPAASGAAAAAAYAVSSAVGSASGLLESVAASAISGFLGGSAAALFGAAGAPAPAAGAPPAAAAPAAAAATGSKFLMISEDGCWASYSTSVEVPECPPVRGKVRADVISACYMAQPVYVGRGAEAARAAQAAEGGEGDNSAFGDNGAFGDNSAFVGNESLSGGDESVSVVGVTAAGGSAAGAAVGACDSAVGDCGSAGEVWSRILMFSEVDPCGWLPATLSKTIASTLFPSTVERIAAAVLDHYGVDWRAGGGYDSALEFAARSLEKRLAPEE